MDIKGNKLEQAKRRDKKVIITDIAISKVPDIEYPNVPSDTSATIRALAQEVLELSKDQNDSNEVAITYSMDENVVGICFGDEHGVNPLSDTTSAHLLMSGKVLTVISLHNHPSTQSFSLEDIQFLIGFPSIQLMVLVGNQGEVYYMSKRSDYSPEKAYALLHEHFRMLDAEMNVKQILNVTDKFLKRCDEAGLVYGKGRDVK